MLKEQTSNHNEDIGKTMRRHFYEIGLAKPTEKEFGNNQFLEDLPRNAQVSNLDEIQLLHPVNYLSDFNAPRDSETSFSRKMSFVEFQRKLFHMWLLKAGAA